MYVCYYRNTLYNLYFSPSLNYISHSQCEQDTLVHFPIYIVYTTRIYDITNNPEKSFFFFSSARACQPLKYFCKRIFYYNANVTSKALQA